MSPSLVTSCHNIGYSDKSRGFNFNEIFTEQNKEKLTVLEFRNKETITENNEIIKRKERKGKKYCK